MVEQRQREERGPAPWLFLLGVVGWTWAWLAPAVIGGGEGWSVWLIICTAVGLMGPLVVPAWLIHRGWWDASLDPTVGHFFRRCVAFGSLNRRWVLALVGLVALWGWGPLMLEPSVLGDEGLIQVVAPAFIFVGLLGALEEPGWRGYGQEALQRRLPVGVAGLVVGLFWALWHLPLFFIGGTYQHHLGVGTVEFWAFMGAIAIISPFYAWLYNAAGRAVVAVLLFHGFGNVARELTPEVSHMATLAVEAAMTAVVLILSWRWMVKRRGGEGRGLGGEVLEVR